MVTPIQSPSSFIYKDTKKLKETTGANVISAMVKPYNTCSKFIGNSLLYVSHTTCILLLHLTWYAGTVLSLTLPRWVAAVLCCQLRPMWPGCTGERELFDETGKIRDIPAVAGSMGLARGLGGGYKLMLVVWAAEWVCAELWKDCCWVTGAGGMACCAVILLTEVSWSCGWPESDAVLIADVTPVWAPDWLHWADITDVTLRSTRRSAGTVLPAPPATRGSSLGPPVSCSDVWN